MSHLRFLQLPWTRFITLFVLIDAGLALPLFAVDLGVARIDVTPVEPIRLTGYGNRTTNSIGVEQKLWAKALAIGTDAEGPALLMTLDNCGIAEETYKELLQRLGKLGVKQDRLAIACSHTHTGPCTTHWAPNIFSRDIPPDQQATIDRYTSGLIDRLEQVARAALKDRRPGKLSWSQGTVGFARNRRVVAGDGARFGDNAAGPVDHSLPVLKIETPDGKLRAIVANYACHCTTLGGEFNRVCGDWAGYAQEYIERDNPGAVAFITIGCGADANPFPRGGADGGLALCKKHGEELAAEVKHLLAQTFVPLTGPLTTRVKEIALPFGPHFSRAQWEERAQKGGIVGYHAKKNLARLDRGEKLPTELYYPIVTWNFGDELALVFLSGEVVVDYGLRLKQEFDPARLWVTAYANYVPCYIPSRRILAEGGYEAEDSLWYYDRPARISTNAEELIIKTVHELLPRSFLFDKKRAEFPDPKTPREALATFRTRADLTVELVASEPLIESPVAIDWDAQGRLWVCEMYDYPTGLDPVADVGRKYGENPKAAPGAYKPGGRIKILTSSKGDGQYDKATLFLDGLPFPTGVTPWRRGALICAAPDILYAEDTDGDGRADLVRTNFTGFATHNYQARVNGFTWGLDGWLHGSSGLFGGKIKSLLTGKTVDLSGRDFRIRPDTGEIEPVAGISQMGRVRDDFDNWFGNDNSTLLWHYPLPDRYARRNPHVTYPDPRVNVAAQATKPASMEHGTRNTDPNHLFPISPTLERFNDPQMANRTTSACGPEIYRDDLLGSDYQGNAFICEPVHNLVTRLVLEPDGMTFTAHRADDEQHSEFLASTDNWFRPVQARTGPDGALWIVDMYRFVIEHPRWIPTNRLAQLDVRAGADMGRIYRVYPRGAKLRPIRNLSTLSADKLAAALDTPNGPTRDTVSQEIINDAAGKTPQALRRCMESENPAVRSQALHLQSALGSLKTSVLARALRDQDPRVRALGLRLAEPSLRTSARPPEALQSMMSAASEGTVPSQAGPISESDPRVRFQLALSLGEWNDAHAAETLARLARTGDRWLRAAVLSSALPHVSGLLKEARDWPADTAGRGEFIAQLCSTAAGSGEIAGIRRALEAITPARDLSNDTTWYESLAALLDAIERRSIALESALTGSSAADRIRQAFVAARAAAGDVNAPEPEREHSIRLLARPDAGSSDDVALLCRLLLPQESPRLQSAALKRLRGQRDRPVGQKLLRQWMHYSPALRPQIIHLLLSRENWTSELLAALESGSVAVIEIPPSDQQTLLRHEADQIRRRAAPLFQRTGTRTEILARYQDVTTLTGVPERGPAVFEKNCAQCHAFRGRGHAVGPNLAEFAGKTIQDFLVAILDPNSAINPGYLAYNLETKDGRSLTGIVRGETASSLTLVQGGGIEEKILRKDIAELRASQLSLMPEGLEQGMAPRDIADLVAWLKKSAPAAFGSASRQQIVKARAEFLADGASGLAKVVACAEQLPYPSWLGRLPMPYCRQNEGQNRLAWRSGPVSLPRSSADSERFIHFRLPAAMGYISQPPGKFTLKVNGKSALEFDVTLADQSCQSADGAVRMTYTVMENNSEDSNGVLVIAVAASRLEPDNPVEFEVIGSASSSQRWFGVYLSPE